MRSTFYLTFNPRGVTGLHKRNRPSLKANEVAIRITTTIPQEVFNAIPEVILTVPLEKILRPVIETEVEDANSSFA